MSSGTTDEMLKLVDELSMSLGIGKPGDPMPGLRFTGAQTDAIQRIIDQSRREAAEELRAGEFRCLPDFQHAADVIDPDKEDDTHAT